MIQETKELKDALKQIAATNNGERKISVKCERRPMGKNHRGVNLYEYGYAKSQVDALTPLQIQQLCAIRDGITVDNYPEQKLAVVRYRGAVVVATANEMKSFRKKSAKKTKKKVEGKDSLILNMAKTVADLLLFVDEKRHQSKSIVARQKWAAEVSNYRIELMTFFWQ